MWAICLRPTSEASINTKHRNCDLSRKSFSIKEYHNLFIFCHVLNLLLVVEVTFGPFEIHQNVQVIWLRKKYDGTASSFFSLLE